MKSLSSEARPRSKSVGAVACDPDECDRTLVRLSAANLLGFDAVKVSANALLARAELSEDAATLKGPRLGRHFTLESGGEVGGAARRARKTTDCLRLPDGRWDTIHVCRPTGRGNEKLFVGLDRSQNDIKRSRHLKFLSEAIAEEKPGCTQWKLPREGSITVAWQEVAKLEADSDFARAVWTSAAASQNINTSAVDTLFASKLQAAVAARQQRL